MFLKSWLPLYLVVSDMYIFRINKVEPTFNIISYIPNGIPTDWHVNGNYPQYILTVMQYFIIFFCLYTNRVFATKTTLYNILTNIIKSAILEAEIDSSLIFGLGVFIGLFLYLFEKIW